MAEKDSCSHDCGNCAHAQTDEDCRLKSKLAKIRNKWVVMSGKGGVGKSTVAVNLAVALAAEGRKVGLLDVDLHGPSIPRMMNLENVELTGDEHSIEPVALGELKVMSLGFILSSPDAPVIWRGPMKIGAIKQFLADVVWGELDDLVIDCPPGTGDEPLTVCQLVAGDGARAVVVTTPQQVAATDVAKSLSFCRELQFPVAGLVENMSGFACPHCGEVTEIFSNGAGEALAKKFAIPFLGKIPIDPAVCRDGDAGRPFIRHEADTPAGKAFAAVVARLTR